MKARDRIILAIDTPLAPIAQWMIEEFAPYVGGFKLGLVAINSGFAHPLIDQIIFHRKKIFWDGKLSDIPNIVARTSRVISNLGVDWFSVHASAGREAIKAAVRNRIRASVLGVTILSSLDDRECVKIFGEFVEEKVMQFAKELSEEGAQGIITSPRELNVLSKLQRASGLIKVAVSIRPEWAPDDDQKRTLTPSEALRLGADYLVIGRPITSPPRSIGTPHDAIRRITQEIESENNTE